MTVSQKIIKRIISDNDFSLRMAIHLKATQVAVILKARRKSNSLLLPNCIEFYKQNGYSDDEILEKQPGRKSS